MSRYEIKQATLGQRIAVKTLQVTAYLQIPSVKAGPCCQFGIGILDRFRQVFPFLGCVSPKRPLRHDGRGTHLARATRPRPCYGYAHVVIKVNRAFEPVYYCLVGHTRELSHDNRYSAVARSLLIIQQRSCKCLSRRLRSHRQNRGGTGHSISCQP